MVLEYNVQHKKNKEIKIFLNISESKKKKRFQVMMLNFD